MAIVIRIHHQNELRNMDINPGKDYKIGRSSKCEIRLNDVTCSGYHASIRIENNRVIVKDLGSTNGSFVNGSNISEAYLFIDETLMIGESEITIIKDLLTNEELKLNTKDEMPPHLATKSTNKILDLKAGLQIVGSDFKPLNNQEVKKIKAEEAKQKLKLEAQAKENDKTNIQEPETLLQKLIKIFKG